MFRIYVFAILFTDAVLDHLSDIIVTGTNPADIERIEEMKTLFGTAAGRHWFEGAVGPSITFLFILRQQ